MSNIRAGIDPTEHLRARIDSCDRVSKLCQGWGKRLYAQRRTGSHLRYRQKLKETILCNEDDEHKKVWRSVEEWLSKRIHLEKASWSGESIATRAHDGVPRNLHKILQSRYAVHVLQTESWLQLRFDSVSVIDQFFARLVDENLTPLATDVTGWKYFLYGADRFPDNPICPIRVIRNDSIVELGFPTVCRDDVMESISTAIMNANLSVVVIEKPRVSLLVLGSISELAKHKRLNESVAPTIRCPLSGTALPASTIEAHILNQSFGSQVQSMHAGFFIEGKSIATKRSGLSEAVSKHPFKFGVKSSSFPAELVIFEADEKSVGSIFSFLGSAAKLLGGFDIETINAACGITSFPRDYPDTQAYSNFWEAKLVSDELSHKTRPLSKRTRRTSSSFCPPWNKSGNSHHTGGFPKVVRTWDYLEAFFDPDIEISGVEAQNLLVTIRIESPRLGKFGPRFAALDEIYEPTQEDYETYLRGCHVTAHIERRCIGLVSSATNHEKHVGLGHITADGLVRLLQAAREHNRRQRRRRLFVIVRDPCDPIRWGVGFITVMA